MESKEAGLPFCSEESSRRVPISTAARPALVFYCKSSHRKDDGCFRGTAK